MKVLKLQLKKKWFDMILSGEKTEEYREIKDYWIRRLIQNNEEMEFQVWDEMCTDLKSPLSHHNSLQELMKYFNLQYKSYDAIEFTNGYAVKSPRVTLGFGGVDIGIGHFKWGAPDFEVFKITIGKEISRLHC